MRLMDATCFLLSCFKGPSVNPVTEDQPSLDERLYVLDMLPLEMWHEVLDMAIDGRDFQGARSLESILHLNSGTLPSKRANDRFLHAYDVCRDRPELFQQLLTMDSIQFKSVAEMTDLERRVYEMQLEALFDLVGLYNPRTRKPVGIKAVYDLHNAADQFVQRIKWDDVVTLSSLPLAKFENFPWAEMSALKEVAFAYSDYGEWHGHFMTDEAYEKIPQLFGISCDSGPSLLTAYVLANLGLCISFAAKNQAEQFSVWTPVWTSLFEKAVALFASNTNLKRLEIHSGSSIKLHPLLSKILLYLPADQLEHITAPSFFYVDEPQFLKLLNLRSLTTVPRGIPIAYLSHFALLETLHLKFIRFDRDLHVLMPAFPFLTNLQSLSLTYAGFDGIHELAIWRVFQDLPSLERIIITIEPLRVEESPLPVIQRTKRLILTVLTSFDEEFYGNDGDLSYSSRFILTRKKSKRGKREFGFPALFEGLSRAASC